MMSISAMKQALDALERGRSQIIGALVQQDQDKAITALREAIAEAEKQEPLCWVYNMNDLIQDLKTINYGTVYGQPVEGMTPLYAAPVHASDISQERVDETPPCKTHPDAPHGFDRNASHSADRYVCECEGWEPPKEWVGLTVDEIDKFMPYCHTDQDLSEFRTFAFEIEAKLKEKNCG
jgi:hypothetical protein